MTVTEFRDRLIQEIAKNDNVKGIGQTGDINAPLIPGKSDIDMFVICTNVPTDKERRDIYKPLFDQCENCMMAVCNGGIWGYGDILFFQGIDVMPMFFTIAEMRKYLEETLSGKHLYKDGRFYPSGRLASIDGLHVWYEENEEWTKLIELVKKHPEDFFNQMLQMHLDAILDEEDLGRSLLRKELLFYHQVLEEALDHFLQAVFALNRTYFPSRKRMEQYLSGFKLKPDNCYERLLHIIQDGAQEETIEKSVLELRELTSELKLLTAKEYIL